METKELKIQIPEGYEIDKNESTFENIVFVKKKDNKPRNWEEYCEQQKNDNAFGYYINANSELNPIQWQIVMYKDMWKNVLPTKELAEKFLAYMQLISLRNAWVGDWKPDWNNSNQVKWVIFKKAETLGGINIENAYNWSFPLSFPTVGMAKDFLKCFRDLLIKAEGLY